jgi:Rha family phage regulatory protein
MSAIVINLGVLDGDVIAESREVAINFEREHKDVLEIIRILIERLEKLVNEGLLGGNFRPTNLFKLNWYRGINNKRQPYYQMTRNGFMLLTGRFTDYRVGETGIRRALHAHCLYMQRFDEMERRLGLRFDPTLVLIEHQQQTAEIIPITRTTSKSEPQTDLFDGLPARCDAETVDVEYGGHKLEATLEYSQDTHRPVDFKVRPMHTDESTLAEIDQEAALIGYAMTLGGSLERAREVVYATRKLASDAPTRMQAILNTITDDGCCDG